MHNFIKKFRLMDRKFIIGIIVTYLLEFTIPYIYAKIIGVSIESRLMIAFILVQGIYNIIILKKYLYYREIAEVMADCEDTQYIAISYIAKTMRLSKKYYNRFKVEKIKAIYTIKNKNRQQLDAQPLTSDLEIKYEVDANNDTENNINKIYYRMISKRFDLWETLSGFFRSSSNNNIKPDYYTLKEENVVTELGTYLKIFSVPIDEAISKDSPFCYGMELAQQDGFDNFRNNTFLIDVSNFSNKSAPRVELIVEYSDDIKKQYELYLYCYDLKKGIHNNNYQMIPIKNIKSNDIDKSKQKLHVLSKHFDAKKNHLYILCFERISNKPIIP